MSSFWLKAVKDVKLLNTVRECDFFYVTHLGRQTNSFWLTDRIYTEEF